MSAFDPTFEQLPGTLPVFPLPEVLLLPRGRLPLNIFEPRYLAMVEDALAADRMIGMIQPLEPNGADRAPMDCSAASELMLSADGVPRPDGEGPPRPGR